MHEEVHGNGLIKISKNTQIKVDQLGEISWDVKQIKTVRKNWSRSKKCKIFKKPIINYLE